MQNFSNSPLVVYTKLSPNHSGQRVHNIDMVTIHCMAGNLSIETCGAVFQSTSRQASSNYGVGSDGRIGMYVEEKNRSWCTSSNANDQRAITIEVANDGGAETGWHVSDKALESLINLCYDICKRNNIKELKWQNDKSLLFNVEKQNMSIHRWFANKSCPGDYLLSKHPYIVSEVNKKLKGEIDMTMTKEELQQFIIETVRNMGKNEDASVWAAETVNKAIENGITDGSNPKSYATREQVMCMTERVFEKCKKE